MPYISAEMLDRKDPEHLNVTGKFHSLFSELADITNLGNLIYDPVIGKLYLFF